MTNQNSATNQNPANHFDREASVTVVPASGVGRADVGGPDTEAGQLGDLLDQTCRSAVQLLSGFECPPRTLRVQAGIVSVEVTWDEKRIVAESAAVAPSADEPEDVPETGLRYLTAPAVGVFYLAPEPGAKPFVSVGDEVVVGQQVAIIEAMKLMIPLEADQAGQVIEVFKENGEPVEYGERVFALADADVDTNTDTDQA